MSKRDKALEKIRNNPTDVSFDKLNALLMSFGFVLRKTTKGKGSHFVYTFGKYEVNVVRRKPVKEFYVKRVIEKIDLVKLEEEAENEN